jgi:hypothetical protein
MAIHMMWENNLPNTIKLVFGRQWNWSEFNLVMEQADNHFARQRNRGCLIFDMREVKSMPEAVTTHMKPLAGFVQQRRCYILVVTESTVVESAFELLTHINRQMHEYVMTIPTIESAHMLLTNGQPPRAVLSSIRLNA